MNYHWIVTILFVSGLVNEAQMIFEFTNIVCESFDKSYANFEKCFLKSVNRTYKYLTVDVAIFELPINNVTIRARTLKRANGYKPFLYDLTFDACQFLKKSNNPVVQFMHDFFKPYSNMNHSCPYNHNATVNKLPTSHIENMITNILPVPLGDYMFDTTWTTYNVKRVNVKVFGTLR